MLAAYGPAMFIPKSRTTVPASGPLGIGQAPQMVEERPADGRHGRTGGPAHRGEQVEVLGQQRGEGAGALGVREPVEPAEGEAATAAARQRAEEPLAHEA